MASVFLITFAKLPGKEKSIPRFTLPRWPKGSSHLLIQGTETYDSPMQTCGTCYCSLSSIADEASSAMTPKYGSLHIKDEITGYLLTC